MARFTLSDKSLTELERYLQELQEQAGKADRAIARKAAEEAAQVARSNAPVDSGELRESIHVEETDDGYAVVAEAPHAAFVEFGTGITGRSAGYPTSEDAAAARSAGYSHDAMGHGEAGWTYYKDGSYHHTTGQVGRGFMARGAEAARRVAGNARLNLKMRGR